MKFGITIPRFEAPGGDAGIAAASLRVSPVTRTKAGLDSLWVMDHFFQIPPVGAAEEPMLEGYSALAVSSRASPSASRSVRSSPASPIDIRVCSSRR